MGLKQSDILVLLVSGTDVYLQPFEGEFITAQLDSEDSANPSISICENSESEAEENPQCIAPTDIGEVAPCDGINAPDNENATSCDIQQSSASANNVLEKAFDNSNNDKQDDEVNE